MDNPNHSTRFWIGNALLVVALLMLMFLGRMWELMGSAAMVLWMALAGVGMYLVTQDKGPSSNLPD